MRIPDDFFQGTTKLRVVHLSGVSLRPSLPSLGFLSNLCALCLNECALQDMAIVGGLKSLQVLSLADSYIVELPKEMIQLSDLRVLDLRDCSELRIIPRDVISSLSRLEYLSLKGCNRIEWERDGVNCIGERNNACLSEIKHLPQLKTLDVQVPDPRLLPEGELLFHNDVNLTRHSIVIGVRGRPDKVKCGVSRIVRVQGVEKESSQAVLKCFSKLLRSCQDLELRELDDIKEVVYELESDGFVQLKHLSIQGCPNIEFILGSWDHQCNTLCMLEQLNLSRLNNLEAVCSGPIPVGCFHNLRLLQLCGCKQLTYVFSSQYPTMHPKQATELAFPHLQSLELRDVPELISFFYSTATTAASQDTIAIFNRQVSFPALESLSVEGLINTSALWEQQLPAYSFSKVLKLLRIKGCHKLQNVFPLCVAKALLKLEDLQISDCDGVETIVSEEENEDEDENENENQDESAFPKVTHLSLSVLPRLKRFCSRMFNLRWPVLQSLQIKRCNKVEVLFEGLMCSNKGDQHIDITTIQQSLFLVGKDSFPNLESISINSSDNMRALWYCTHSFPRLKKLDVDSCGKLLNVFPLSMANALGQLEQLRVESCEAVEEIVTSQEDETTASLSLLPNLTSLTLKKLPQVKAFCSKRFASRWPHLKSLQLERCAKVEILFAQETGVEGGIAIPEIQPPFFFLQKDAFPALESILINRLDSMKMLCYSTQISADFFPRLKKLDVKVCDKLLNIFPLSVAKTLGQLESLRIGSCDVVAEIVTSHEDETKASLSLFPNLTTLELTFLPQLKKLCSKRFASRWPRLQSLTMCSCDNVEILFIQETGLEGGLNTTEIQQPFFFLQKDSFPALESISIYGLNSMRALWYDAHSFPRLQKLSVEYCGKLLNIFPLSVAKALGQLEQLQIESCQAVEEIVTSHEDETVASIFLFPNLTTLTLRSLGQLKKFCSKRIASRWPRLKSLKLSYCDKLEIYFIQETGTKGGLASTEIQQPFIFLQKDAFPALESMSIYSSDGMRALWYGKISIASFPKLERLRIDSCKAVEEIVTSHEDETTSASLSLFPNLTSLDLTNLPQLKKFCSKSFTSRLPHLKSLELDRCAKVEILFVQETGVEGGLETTETQQPFFLLQKDAFPALEAISIQSLDSLRALWYSPQISTDFFPKLKELKVDNCRKLLNIFPLSVAKALGQLERLEIESCEALEEIVTSHEDETTASLSLFPSLTSLQLSNLPQLKKFCSKRFASRWPCLKSLELEGCDKVETLFVQETCVEGGGSATTEIQQPFFPLQKEAFPNLEELNIMNLRRIVEVWQGQFSGVSFSKLRKLTIQKCRCISVVITPRNEVIQAVDGGPTIDDEIDFPLLKILKLQNLPNLKSFCSVTCRFRFPSLKRVLVRKCPMMEFFCKGKLHTPRLKFEKMGILLRIFWETDLNTTISLIRQAYLEGTIDERQLDFMSAILSEGER